MSFHKLFSFKVCVFIFSVIMLANLATTLASADSYSSAMRKPNFSGAWQRNDQESDDIKKVIDNAIAANSTGGGPLRGRLINGQMRSRLEESIGNMLAASRMLTINHNDPELIITPESGKRRIIYTDARPQTQSALNGGQVEVVTQWEGRRLVTRAAGARGSKVTAQYDITSEPRHLKVSISVENSQLKSPVAFQVVYDPAPVQ